jgi:hypothetical protein
MNLITSCWDCNRGKGAKKLDGNDIVDKLKQQIDKINEKRVRLETMIQWRQGLIKLAEREARALGELFNLLTTNCHMKRLKAIENEWVFELCLREYSFNEVADAVEDCVGVYCKRCGDPEGLDKCFMLYGNAVEYSCWERRTEAATS